jgi:hypothetical protein
MKLTTVLICLLVSFTAFGNEKPKPTRTHVITRKMDIFYFKVHKEMLGSVVEVFAANGEKLTEQTLTRRRNLIDFYNENPGQFTIQITKGSEKETFEYQKKSPSPLIPIEFERGPMIPAL